MKKILEACKLIKDGNIIVYPTDTIYGFGVDATNSKAIEKLNELKLRKQCYSIIVDTLEMANKYVTIPDNIKSKMTDYFPGPYTGIFKKKNNSDISELVNLEFETIGIRIPKNNFAINLVSALQKPIITTSVNIHGEPSLNNPQQIKDKFSNINIFTDEKINYSSKGSTIIDFTKTPIILLRQGDGVFLS